MKVGRESSKVKVTMTVQMQKQQSYMCYMYDVQVMDDVFLWRGKGLCFTL